MLGNHPANHKQLVIESEQRWTVELLNLPLENPVVGKQLYAISKCYLWISGSDYLRRSVTLEILSQMWKTPTSGWFSSQNGGSPHLCEFFLLGISIYHGCLYHMRACQHHWRSISAAESWIATSLAERWPRVKLPNEFSQKRVNH